MSVSVADLNTLLVKYENNHNIPVFKIERVRIKILDILHRNSWAALFLQENTQICMILDKFSLPIVQARVLIHFNFPIIE